MKIIELSGRSSGSPMAFLDMTGRFNPISTPHSKAWHIGDRAAGRHWLTYWRDLHPTAHITIIDEETPSWQASVSMPASWVFEGLADTVWLAESEVERIDRPVGIALYHTGLWHLWRYLKVRGDSVKTVVRLPAAARRRAQRICNSLKIKKQFVCVHPLQAAKADKHRNGDRQWWIKLISKIALTNDVVLIGHSSETLDVDSPAIKHLADKQLSVVEGLAVAERSSLFVGGATGTTLWVGLMGRPVLACYDSWAIVGNTDCRPIVLNNKLTALELHGRAAKVDRALFLALGETRPPLKRNTKKAGGL